MTLLTSTIDLYLGVSISVSLSKGRSFLEGREPKWSEPRYPEAAVLATRTGQGNKHVQSFPFPVFAIREKQRRADMNISYVEVW